jgi:hypothetical protein
VYVIGVDCSLTAKCFVGNTLANTPLRDPESVFPSIKLTPAERWGYVYRDDVGAYNIDGSVVNFDNLPSNFVCDTVVGLDVNLS